MKLTTHIATGSNKKLRRVPMGQQSKITLFKNQAIRSHWDADQEEWFFSVVDVVAVLTDSANPTDYLKKLRKRDEQLGEYLGTHCPQVAMASAAGKTRKILAATTQQLLRIIQSVPSKKAEPFKLWLADVANQRLDQLQDPELSIEQAMLDYKRLGYSDNWINQRLKSIEIRKELTDEWKRHGLQEGAEFAFLTDVIYKTWAGKSAKKYKQHKDLKKENLRDNMTNTELVMNMLAELSTKEISEAVQPQTLPEHASVAKRGGGVAKQARLRLEAETGKKVVSSQNAKQNQLINKTPELTGKKLP
jgi:prophage antirepressor-like protein